MSLKSIRQIIALLIKDFTAELRTKELFTSMIVFVLLTLVIFNFAFSGSRLSLEVIVGAIWVAFLFAANLGLSRSFVREVDKGCLEGLLLCPAERYVIYFGKAIGNLIFILAVELLTLPILPLFFSNSSLLNEPLKLIGVFILGSAGISFIGTLFSAMTANLKARELLLPLLAFPILTPVLIASVKLTLYLANPSPIYEPARWLQLLLVYDIIFSVLAYITFEFVVEE